jgi:hypothetical protein
MKQAFQAGSKALLEITEALDNPEPGAEIDELRRMYRRTVAELQLEIDDFQVFWEQLRAHAPDMQADPALLELHKLVEQQRSIIAEQEFALDRCLGGIC